MTPKPRSDSVTFAIVQVITLIFTLLAGWFVTTQGVAELPSIDEWDLLNDYQFVDRQPIWYIRHHNEHRYPLTKFLWLQLLQLTNYNFKAPMYLTVGLLSATAFLFQWTARGRRGYSTIWDAVYPALLLHWGHAFNLIMSYQFGFALVAYACAGWIWADRWFQNTGRLLWLILTLLYVMLLSTTGGFGLAFTPAVAGWLTVRCSQAFRSQRTLHGVLLALSTLTVVGYSGWCYQTMPKLTVSDGLNLFESPLTFCISVLRFLTCGVDAWVVFPNGIRRFLSMSIWLLLLASAIHGWNRQRHASVTCWWVWLGTATVGVAMATARGEYVADRYASVAVTGVAALWLMASLSWRSNWWNWPLSLGLCAGLFLWQAEDGLRHGQRFRIPLKKMCDAIHAGATPLELAGQYGGSCSVIVGERIEWELPRLKALGLPLLQHMMDTPPLNKDPFPIKLANRSFIDDKLVGFPNPPANCWGVQVVLAGSTETRVDFARFHWTDGEGHAREQVAHLLMIHEKCLLVTRFHDTRTSNVSLELFGLHGQLAVVESVWLTAP